MDEKRHAYFHLRTERFGGGGMPLLTDDQVAEALKQLVGWDHEGQAVNKTYRLASFPAAIAFINAVAVLAEEANHHPEIHNSYNHVTLHLTTHDAGGLTKKDITLAQRIDALPF